MVSKINTSDQAFSAVYYLTVNNKARDASASVWG
jgi:hypothetical protein